MTGGGHFFPKNGPFALGELAELVAGVVAPRDACGIMIDSVASLEAGSKGAICFIDNAKYISALKQTDASACITAAKTLGSFPPGVVALVVDDPYLAYAHIAEKFFPTSVYPQPFATPTGAIAQEAIVSPDARIEDNVTIGAGTVIGDGVIIGAGSQISPQSYIDSNVVIGRNCYIASHCSIQCALIGDNVIIHPGVKIGQDGFGFAMTSDGHFKVPQIGRVVIHNAVEIGANTCIDRGTNQDTVIGQGTKIDNLVQIGHNVKIGRHCMIVAQVGIAGSAVLEDFVILAGQVGVNGHITIGKGVKVGAQSGVLASVPAGQTVLGSPARLHKRWLKSMVLLDKMANTKRKYRSEE